NGVARRDLHGLTFAFAIAARKSGAGEESVVLGQGFGEGISPWDFNMVSSSLERYVQGYVYTDRPLYQPTHEVFFKGILRNDDDAVLTMPEEKEVEVEVFDSGASSIFKKKLPIGTQGTFAGSLKLDEKAPLGMYSIVACSKRSADNSYCAARDFQASFFVEEYRKPEYQLTAAFDKESYVNHEELKASVDAKYFFGAPVANGSVSWSLKAQNYYFDEYKGEWFSFTDHETYRKCYFGCPYDDRYIDEGSGVLDENGKFSVSRALDLSTKDAEGKPKPPDASRIYTFGATVQDKNNQSVYGQKEVIVHRGQFYVGIKNEEYVIGRGQEMPIKVIAVDPKGNPLPGKSVKVEINK
ncbi:hypothetical protein HYV58_00975, partial [Candidatus Peregrinibacteria bacterium]|nr:hypothetical protein [Candidatus Peregrinibacteria bacterium]